MGQCRRRRESNRKCRYIGVSNLLVNKCRENPHQPSINFIVAIASSSTSFSSFRYRAAGICDFNTKSSAFLFRMSSPSACLLRRGNSGGEIERLYEGFSLNIGMSSVSLMDISEGRDDLSPSDVMGALKGISLRQATTSRASFLGTRILGVLQVVQAGSI